MLAVPAGVQPNGFAHLLEAIERYVTTPMEIAIVGDPGDPRTVALRREVARRLLPAAVKLTGPSTDASPLLSGREARGGAPTAYVCEHYTCRQPVTEPEALRAQLDELLAARGARPQQAAR
jgi:uncharacterized protein YyaL (SSP411 family)